MLNIFYWLKAAEQILDTLVPPALLQDQYHIMLVLTGTNQGTEVSNCVESLIISDRDKTMLFPLPSGSSF